MIEIYVFFPDPLTVGKIAELAKKIDPQIICHKIIDVRQLFLTHKGSNCVLITSPDLYNQHIKGQDIQRFFQSYILPDDNETQRSKENIHFINQKLLITQLRSVLNQYIKEVYDLSPYIPIALDQFEEKIRYPCDLYLKLSAKKYIKVLKEQTSFHKETLEKLAKKGITSLYVKNENYQYLKEFLFTRASEIKISPKQVHLGAIESLHKLIVDIGFNEKIIQQAESLQHHIEKKITSKYMQNLFKTFKKTEGSFLYNHTYLTAIIALNACDYFDWMTPAIKEKIYLATILHDLGYQNTDNALRELLSKKEIQTLPFEQKNDIFEHTNNFSRHLAQVDKIDQDIIKIVRDHHGVYGEDAYPREIQSNDINLVFALFVLSHEFTLILFKTNFNLNQIESSLESLEKKFNNGKYKNILKEFKESILRIKKINKAIA
ncbi:MAG: hypothetical protein CME66_07410 [Halobacteriovoraceae bacterium]|jgi:putative nucleotidyltransferase with HDIG domain|nr:hypothetical protein [Halobacteriovoraceae bacterium]